MDINLFNGKNTQVVAVGSVDGVLTTAAFLRSIGNLKNVGVEFTQAFQVDKIDVARWALSSIVLIDLAVNNKDESMTADFVRRIQDAGHTISAVIDEHDADAWRRVLGEEVFSALVVKPQSQKTGPFKSSGAILLDALGDEADDHTRELCQAADAGDQMDFTTHFGGYANKSVKSAIWDNGRRIHLARRFAGNREPDEKIIDWCKEYDTILVTH